MTKQNQEEENHYGIARVGNYHTDLYKTLFQSPRHIMEELAKGEELAHYVQDTTYRHYIVHLGEQIHRIAPPQFVTQPLQLPPPVAATIVDDEIPF